MSDRLSGRARVLLVEPDPTLLKALSRLLVEAYAVETAATTEAALAAIERSSPDIVLLENDLPDMTGLDLCRQIRHLVPDARVLLMIGANEPEMSVEDRGEGPDAIVVKPIRLTTLTTQMDTLLRRGLDAVAVRIGPYRFYASDRVLTDATGTQIIRLTEKEAGILQYLARDGIGAIPRERLLSEVWGYGATITTHTLETHIYRLRQKIETDPSRAALLVSDSGGYRLVR